MSDTKPKLPRWANKRVVLPHFTIHRKVKESSDPSIRKLTARRNSLKDKPCVVFGCKKLRSSVIHCRAHDDHRRRHGDPTRKRLHLDATKRMRELVRGLFKVEAQHPAISAGVSHLRAMVTLSRVGQKGRNKDAGRGRTRTPRRTVRVGEFPSTVAVFEKGADPVLYLADVVAALIVLRLLDPPASGLYAEVNAGCFARWAAPKKSAPSEYGMVFFLPRQGQVRREGQELIERLSPLAEQIAADLAYTLREHADLRAMWTPEAIRHAARYVTDAEAATAPPRNSAPAVPPTFTLAPPVAPNATAERVRQAVAKMRAKANPTNPTHE